MSKPWKVTLFSLALITTTIWLAIIFYPAANLQVIACDVGQGDGILVQYKTTQILFDGGPNNRILDCLSRYMPFWDRKIEVIILSHPQKDHYMGLIEVVKLYDVDKFVSTPLDASAQEWQVLKEEVRGKGIGVINPTTSMIIRIGLIHLDIFWPSEEFLTENLVSSVSNLTIQQSSHSSGVLGAFTSKLDPNVFSVVVLLSFKDFDALFTGDIDPKISEVVAKRVKTNDQRPIEYIKIPHHGSKNGLTKNLLEAVMPEVAVISVGKNNSYGHPHDEILKLLGDKTIKILRTDEMGDVIVESDGERIWIDK